MWPLLLAGLACLPALAADPVAAPADAVPALEPAAAGPAAPAMPTVAAPQSRVDLYARFRAEYEAKHYAAAAALAATLVGLTEQEVGTAGEELQVALMNHAISQYLSGDYLGAEASFLRAIELTEASPRPRVERLARAHAGLAATYYAGRRYDLAVARYERAVAYSRRSEGLLSEAQLPLLEKFADALTELGRYEDALKLHRYRLRIAERKYGERDPRVAPTLEKIGRWYARVGAYDMAIPTLRRAIDIVEDVEGEKSPNLIGPLTAIADCSRRRLTDPTQVGAATPDADHESAFRDPALPIPYSPAATITMGQKALDRAVAIATERPDPSPAQIADVRTQYGDWFQTRGLPERALEQYQQAWQAGAGTPYQGTTLAEALFARPVLIVYTRPPGWDRYAGRPSSEVLLKVVQLATTVTADGRTSDTQVIDDSGDPKRAAQARLAVATARYRPRFENGQPVATPDVPFTQVFQVLVPKETPAPEVAPQVETRDTSPGAG